MNIFVNFVYIAVVVFTLVLAIREYRYFTYPRGNYSCVDNGAFYLLLISVLFVTAFRVEYFGGPDTINYVYYFEEERSSYYYSIDVISDIGYIELMHIMRFFINSRWLFIVFMSLLTLLPLFCCINRFSADKTLSLVLFITFPMCPWLLTMAAMRQSVAMSAIFIAMLIKWSCNFKHKNYVIVLLLIIACLLHRASFLYIILLCLFSYKQIPKKVLYICLCVSWLAVSTSDLYAIFFDMFSSLLGDYSSSEVLIRRYYDQELLDNKTLLNMLPYNVLPALLVYYSKEDSETWIFTQIFVLGACFYNIVCSAVMAPRMTAIFYFILLFALPRVSITKQKEYYTFMYVLVLYFAWRNIVSLSSLTEFTDSVFRYFHYKFMWE